MKQRGTFKIRMSCPIKIFTVILILLCIFAFVACESEWLNYKKVDYIQSNGLSFKIMRGPSNGAGFVMRNNKGEETSTLYSASTPFSVSKIGEEKKFTIKVKEGGLEKGDLYFFYIVIKFDEVHLDDVLKLTGRDKGWKYGTCVATGEQLSFYLRIVANDENKYFFEKVESHICATMHDKNTVYKRITYTDLKPGIYTIQIRNEIETQAFQKYELLFLIMQSN